MSWRRFWLPLSIAVALVLVCTAVPALQAQDSHIMKIGKNGEVKFSSETHVGDLVLKPGVYHIQHRVEGEEHHVSFLDSSRKLVGEVKCKLEMMNSKGTSTAVTTSPEGNARRVTRVEIAGENVAHVF